MEVGDEFKSVEQMLANNRLAVDSSPSFGIETAYVSRNTRDSIHHDRYQL